MALSCVKYDGRWCRKRVFRLGYSGHSAYWKPGSLPSGVTPGGSETFICENESFGCEALSQPSSEKRAPPLSCNFAKWSSAGRCCFPRWGILTSRASILSAVITRCARPSRSKTRRIANQGTALGPFRLCQEPAGILSARGLQAFTANLLKACKRVLQRVFNLFC